MGREERRPEGGFFSQHRILTGITVVGIMEVARRIYKAAPLTIVVDTEGVRRFAFDPTFRERFENYTQGIYSPPMADDSHRMTFNQSDINAGRVRHSSETNPTNTKTKEKKVKIEDVPDPDKERLTASSSLFPDGLDAHLEQVDAFLERTKDL